MNIIYNYNYMLQGPPHKHFKIDFTPKLSSQQHVITRQLGRLRSPTNRFRSYHNFFYIYIVYWIYIFLYFSKRENMENRLILFHYITERSVRWYYGISIAAPPSPPPRPPRRREHSNSKSIQPISFKFYMRVDTPLRFFAIEIWYPPRTRTTAFAAKRHLYPPNLQNAISP